ncbi:hypothetical protein CGRA01v4_10886 [Colletotrichum graminicola]|nr:hypothetical protein CGRA01v4_10886 [Colletotrichum graminicola]
MKVPFILSLALIVAQVQATCYKCSCIKRDAQMDLVHDSADTDATCGAKGGRKRNGYCYIDIDGDWRGEKWLNTCAYSGNCRQASSRKCH